MIRKITVPTLLLVACVLAACGSTKTVTQTVTVSQASAPAAPTTNTTPPAITVDQDDADAVDQDAADDASSTDCDELGINPEGLEEGNCESEGYKYQIVNRATPLKLPELAAKLNSIDVVTSIPRSFDSPLTGNFVVANVSITNRMNQPVETTPDMYALNVGGKSFNPNSDAMIDVGNNKLVYDEIQPDETFTGKVIFNVSPKAAKALDEDGNFDVLQFSDADGFSEPTKRIGIIRTYN